MKPNGKMPGRPIEREYLAALNAAVPLETWRAICERAATGALAGDAKARDWLSKWLLGLEERPLTRLAAEESAAEPDTAADGEIAARRQKIEDKRKEAEFNRTLTQSLYS
jgi:plasmid stability protein